MALKITDLIDDLRTMKLLHGNIEVQVARDVGVYGLSKVGDRIQIEVDFEKENNLSSN